MRRREEIEGEKNHKKGGGVELCFQKLFFLTF